jgi:aminomethyltransferase
MTEMNGWKRVLSYGNPDSEWKACHSSIGICDVTPIAKIDLQGGESEKLLSRLVDEPVPAVGRCLSAIQKTGLAIQAARLRADRILVLGAAEDRIRLLSGLSSAAGVGCVHVNDLSSAFAAMRLVGPRTPSLLKKLTSAQVEALPHNGCFQAGVARIPAILIRNDFGTEYAGLLMVARDYGAYMWECVLSAGHEFGIQPIGIVVERRMASREVTDVAAV